MNTARVVVEVVAGLIPKQPMPELTRRFTITSEEWGEAKDQMELLAKVNGQAQGYASLLMLQPQSLNWVETTWIWL